MEEIIDEMGLEHRWKISTDNQGNISLEVSIRNTLVPGSPFYASSCQSVPAYHSFGQPEAHIASLTAQLIRGLHDEVPPALNSVQ